MKRAFQCVLLAALVASFAMLTGCWNYQELESRYVVSGIAVDRGKQGHRYLLTFEVLDLSGAGNGGAGDGAGGQMKGKLIRSEGDTIADAVDEASKISDKELYYSDCKVIVFSRQIAEDGLTPVLDWLNRDPKPRFTVQAFVSGEKTAGELFQPGGATGGGGQQASQQSGSQQQGGVISMEIANSMEAISTGGRSIQMHIYDVDNVLLGEGRELALPLLKKSGKQNNPVEVHGTAVFRGDRYVGVIDDELSQDYLLAMSSVENSVMVVGESPADRNLSLLVRKTSVSVDPEVSGGKISMKIKVKMQCSFDEENSQQNYLLDLGVNKIEDFADASVKAHIGRVVKQVQTQFASDIFGFGRRIYQEKPNEWKKLKASWPQKFRSLSVDVEPDVTIINAEFAHPKGYA